MSEPVYTTGELVELAALIVSNSGSPVTGLSPGDAQVRLVRMSDDFFYDWNDDTFKSAGHTTPLQDLTELSATLAPGIYEVAGGWDTSAATNLSADDTYLAVWVDNALPGNANLPTPISFRIGSFADNILDVAGDVWDEDIVAAHGTADTAGLLLRALGALISQRSNNPTLDSLLGVPDSAGADVPSQTTDEVWDEDIVAAHGTSDTAGLLLRALGALISQRSNTPTLEGLLGVPDSAGADVPSQTTDEVWDELTSSHVLAGSFGEALGRRIAAVTAATAGSTPTEIRTGLTQVDDFFNNMPVVVVNSAGVVARNINDYANTNGAITVDTLPFTPAVSDPVLILGTTGSVPVDTDSITDAVWDEDIVAAHGTADTAGLLLRVLGALISQRSNNPTLNALLGVADVAGSDLEGNIRGSDDRDLSELAGSGFSTTDTLEAIRDRIDQTTIAVETTAASGSTSTEIRTGLTQADDFFNNMQVIVINSAGVAARDIDDYANTNGAITVDALPFTPAMNDPVLILARAASTADLQAIATQLWSTILPGSFTGDQAGARLAAIDTGDDACHMSATYDQSNTAIDITVWLERGGIVSTSPTSSSISWYNPDGTLLFSAGPNSSPDAQGHFRFQQTQTLVNNEPYYVVVSITDGSGTVTTDIGTPLQAG